MDSELNRLLALSGVETTDSKIEELVLEYVTIEQGESIEEIDRKLEIARRMLGLANKLKKPEEKKKHLHMVMVIMNKLRGALQRELSKLDADRSTYEYSEIQQLRDAGLRK